ncbi:MULTISPECIES: hypothetical protein [Dysgonomonas]|uniref:Conjugal transfer protein TraD n=1 Tax=Dysgonomonas hofstadii TaxID=637886 RepID=A0A840D1K1_9BACT|nr:MULTISPECIES: hypothetical protein [Dysgonomonas]MBB4038193.1 hypothetical protein [Dysgonomonas hofstadii]MBS5908640.1 hypothetical protein [Dysgonomonas mossii]
MKQYIISAIVLYALFVVLYLLRERMQKRKKNAAKKSVFNPFRAAPKEDIIGKSKFDIRQSRTEATTLINNEKENKNASIFVEKEEKKTSVAIPLDKLDEVFSTDNKTEENSDEINLEIENTPPEFEPDNDSEEIDETESEEEDTEGRAGVSMALGLDFNNLASMVRTVETPDNATSEEKEEAGRVLVEIRKTDMFEQVVSGEPKKKVVVSSLMDDYFAAFHRKQQEAEVSNEPIVKAPKEFDVRRFA